jgi:hypothetical protein
LLKLASTLEPQPGAFGQSRRFHVFAIDLEEMLFIRRRGCNCPARERFQAVAVFVEKSYFLYGKNVGGAAKGKWRALAAGRDVGHSALQII